MHYTLKDHQGNLTATIHGNSMERLRYDDNNSLKGESRNEKYHKKYHPHNSSGGYNHPGTRNPSQKENVEQTEIKPDSLKEDSMKAFYERMRRWGALHGGMRQRESDK